mmetsp:Transcript_13091/g.27683  ORF Transcript_13091/g.27683 Transcript_13091/m.27683 type:complete len:398 (-) Transcript_13091:15-1208(-)
MTSNVVQAAFFKTRVSAWPAFRTQECNPLARVPSFRLQPRHHARKHGGKVTCSTRPKNVDVAAVEATESFDEVKQSPPLVVRSFSARLDAHDAELGPGQRHGRSVVPARSQKNAHRLHSRALLAVGGRAGSPAGGGHERGPFQLQPRQPRVPQGDPGQPAGGVRPHPPAVRGAAGHQGPGDPHGGAGGRGAGPPAQGARGHPHQRLQHAGQRRRRPHLLPAHRARPPRRQPGSHGGRRGDDGGGGYGRGGRVRALRHAQRRQARQGQFGFVMHLLPGSRGSSDIMAAPIDRAMDVDLGVLSTLVRAENFCPNKGRGYATPGNAFFINLGIKINLKLGGVHSTWALPPHLQRSMVRTVVMGGDSTRSPGTSAVAAVTGSLDDTCARFIGRARINGSAE